MARVKKCTALSLLFLFLLSTFTFLALPKTAFASDDCPNYDKISGGFIGWSRGVISVVQTENSVEVTYDVPGAFQGNDICNLQRSITNPYPNSVANASQSGNSQLVQPFSNNTFTYLSKSNDWLIVITHDKTIGYVYQYNKYDNSWTAKGTLSKDAIKSSVESIKLEIIDKGKIGGFLVRSGEWKNKDAKIDQNVNLYSERTDDPIFRNGQINTDPEKLTYEIAVTKLGVDGGISAGKYTLKYEGHNQGSNCDGTTGLIGYCTVNWKGETEIEIIRQSDGSGKAKILKTDPTTKQKVGDIVNLDNIGIGVVETVSSPFDGAIQAIFQNMLGFISNSMKAIGNWINTIIVKGNSINDDGLKEVWLQVRNLSLSLLTLGLLIIAFANILSIDIEKYGLARMVPKLVIGIVMTYFSFVIIQFLLELTSALQLGLLNGQSLDAGSIGGIADFYNGSAGVGTLLNTFGLALLLIIIGVIIVLAMLWLCIVLTVRIVVIWFLVAIAPLAFMMQIMPFTENLWGEWWKNFWKWAFMGPAVVFLLWLTQKFLSTGFGTNIENLAANNVDSWLMLLMAAAGIFMAASIPMKMGGDVYKGIQDGWNKSKKVPGLKGVHDRYAMRQKSKEGARNLKLQQQQARLAQKAGPIGRWAAGVDQRTANAQRAALVGDLEKGLAGKSTENIQKIAKGKGFEAEAAQNWLAKTGNLDTNDAAFVRQMTERAQEDTDFGNIINDKQKDFYTKAAMTIGAGGQNWRPQNATEAKIKENADNSIIKTKAEDYKVSHFQYMEKVRPDMLSSFARNADSIKAVRKGSHEIQLAASQAFINKGINNPYASGSEEHKIYNEIIDTANQGQNNGIDYAI